MRGSVHAVKPARCWAHQQSNTFKNPKVLLPLYKTIVRPHLEYYSAVWSPQYVKDKFLLKRVQHRVSRMFPELKSLPTSNGSTSWDYGHLKSVVIEPTYWKFLNWLKVAQLSLGHTSLSESTTELPGSTSGRLWRRTAVAIYAITQWLQWGGSAPPY